MTFSKLAVAADPHGPRLFRNLSRPTLKSACVSWQPYDADGVLSSHCRQWIIEMVRDEVERLGLSICVVFGPDDAVAVWPGDKLVISKIPPEGGLLI